ncbi:MAG TPA: type I secretion system permease/ATPase [Candidatus Binatia bacterium]|nr:type I secretion system permease/ATPase [Candidatus Binatia bacterium]
MTTIAKPRATAIRLALRSSRAHIVAASLFSLGINLLYLTPTIYMLQVYNRVMNSGHIPTLIMISLAALLGMLTLAVLEAARNHILVRLSNHLDVVLAGEILRRQIEITNVIGERPGMVRDLDSFRGFLTQTGASAIFDMPWLPIYLLACFMLHPVLGLVACVAMAIMVVLAFTNEIVTSKYLRRSEESARKNYGFTDASLRNAEVIQAMGMLPGFLRRWSISREEMLRQQTRASELGAYLSGSIRFFRLSLQSGIIGIGAWMAIEGEVTAGVIYAASILLARTISPIEQLVAGWRSFVGARGAIKRINELLAYEPNSDPMRLPAPRGMLSVETVGFVPRGGTKPTLHNVSFVLQPGERLAVVGPSGAGKSTLARLIVGVWRPRAGSVRLDSADVYFWERTDFGRHVGYLPQEVELFEGTIRDNIARFSDASPEQVVEAAQRAGVHDLILRLPEGYDTEIGVAGSVLSGGTRQRVGLARAILGNPKLLVLDEPNSNLDSDGERALLTVLNDCKDLGTTTIVISHRSGVLSAVDKVLLLRDGTVERLSPRAEFLAALGQPDPQARIASQSGGGNTK